MPAMFATHSFELHTWAPAPQARLAKVAFAPPAGQPCITEEKLCPTATLAGQNETTKLVVTLWSAVIFERPQVLDPLHEPDQPVNIDPEVRVAVNVLLRPVATVALQVPLATPL